MAFDIDRYIGLWRNAEGFLLEIKKVDERRASASLYSPVGSPIDRPYFEDKPSIEMPATYDDYLGTMTVQLRCAP